MAKRLIRLPAVKARVDLSKSSIYQMVREGAFPRPIKIGPRACAWLEDEVDAWIEDRIAQRDGDAA